MSVTDPKRASKRIHHGPTLPSLGLVLRTMILATVAVVGSIWGLVRYYTHVHARMVVPVMSATPSPSSAPTEIPAPELVPMR